MMRRMMIGLGLMGALALMGTMGLQVAPVEVAKPQAGEQSVRLMTYNVENFNQNFMAFHVNKTTQPDWPPAALELIARERKEDDEENWEVARTITDVRPDIWVLQEGCDLADLKYFNKEFLKDYFETVHVFATNTDPSSASRIGCNRSGGSARRM